jgi:hypothetical protein
MADHYKWYPSTADSVIPWNQRYEYPTEANKALKTTPRIPPKNGSTFISGNTIRLEFPASGYVNPANFTIVFDVGIQVTSPTADNSGSQWSLYIQNNIHSLFSRIRLMYGATPLEDIIGSNFLVRQLTEWTTSPASYVDQTSIALGIAGTQVVQGTTATNSNMINGRKLIHSVTKCTATDRTITPLNTVANETDVFPSGNATSKIAYRRYQIQLPLGLMTQGKYIPTKFMASQLAVELTVAKVEEALIFNRCTKWTTSVVPETGGASFTLSNVNMIPEILEFDASYDEEFLKGLMNEGVPIPFSSWHNFPYPQGGSTLNNIVIQEKSRSVKAIFAMLKLQSDRLENDTGATYAGLGGTLDSYQYRIGGRFYPASPVVCSGWESLAGAHNGACEAYVELQKCLNMLGDSRLSTAVTHQRWAMPLVPVNGWETGMAVPTGVTKACLPSYANCSDGLIAPAVESKNDLGEFSRVVPAFNGYSTASLSSVFCMATCLETTNGRELSGLNAEEQADITLLVKFSNYNTTTFGLGESTESPSFNYEIYTYYDAMLMLRENNIVQLIT